MANNKPFYFCIDAKRTRFREQFYAVSQIDKKHYELRVATLNPLRLQPELDYNDVGAFEKQMMKIFRLGKEAKRLSDRKKMENCFSYGMKHIYTGNPNDYGLVLNDAEPYRKHLVYKMVVDVKHLAKVKTLNDLSQATQEVNVSFGNARTDSYYTFYNYARHDAKGLKAMSDDERVSLKDSLSVINGFIDCDALSRAQGVSMFISGETKTLGDVFAHGMSNLLHASARDHIAIKHDVPMVARRFTTGDGRPHALAMVDETTDLAEYGEDAFLSCQLTRIGRPGDYMNSLQMATYATTRAPLMDNASTQRICDRMNRFLVNLDEDNSAKPLVPEKIPFYKKGVLQW